MIIYRLMRGGTKARPCNIVFMGQAGRKEFIKPALLVFFSTNTHMLQWMELSVMTATARDQIMLAQVPIFFGFSVRYISR